LSDSSEEFFRERLLQRCGAGPDLFIRRQRIAIERCADPLSEDVDQVRMSLIERRSGGTRPEGDEFGIAP